MSAAHSQVSSHLILHMKLFKIWIAYNMRSVRDIPPKTTGLLVLTIVSLASVIASPHSKVEESFNLQATHDVYYHGIRPALASWWHSYDVGALPYDHLKYPGVVPRTFLGPIILAASCRLVGLLFWPLFDLSSRPLLVQSLSRIVLLSLNLHAMYRLGGAADSRFAPHRHRPRVGGYLFLITSAQFHLPYYFGRTLPNVFALVAVTHAYADWLSGRSQRAAALLVFAAAVFRCDILILLFAVGLAMLLRRDMTVLEALRTGVATVFASLMMTVPVDSILWCRPLWPEGEVFIFNAVENKSSEWGTSSWHWYFSSALPKALLLTALLIPLSVLRLPEVGKVVLKRREENGPGGHLLTDLWDVLFDLRVVPFFLPIVAFVACYSCLPHKEMRFIFPALPMLNVAAAMGLERLHQAAFPVLVEGKEKVKSRHIWDYFALLLFLGGVGSVAASAAGNAIFVAVSSRNYPGGDALMILRDHIENIPEIHAVVAHVDVASAMSGVSLFSQRAASYSGENSGVRWSFSKSGYEKKNEIGKLHLGAFTHLLSEARDVKGFQVIGVAQGHPRFDLRKMRVDTQDRIFVLERRS